MKRTKFNCIDILPEWRHDIEASISLMATIMLVGLLTISLVLQQISALRIFQAETSQAMASQLGVSLANFDRELQERYGLWGMREENINTEIFQEQMALAMDKPLLPPAVADADISLGEALIEPEIAKKQICSYMQLRAPIGLIKEIYTRTAEQGKDWHDSWQNNKDELNETGTQWLRNRAGLMSLMEEKLPDSVRSALQPIFDFFSLESANENGQQGGFSVSNILSVLSNIGSLLNVGSISGYDSFLINEYAIDSFSNAAGKFGESTTLGKTWGGFSKSGLKTQTPFEVEYIITGIENKEKAAKRVLLYIKTLRLLQHFADIWGHSLKRNPYKVSAVAISLALEALTFGSVYIPSEIIEGILIFISAYIHAGKDAKKLLKGEKIVLQPGYVEDVKIYYKDFLRLFLLAVREDEKLIRTIAVIQENLQGEFYTRADIQVKLSCGPWRGGVVERHESYSLLYPQRGD